MKIFNAADFGIVPNEDISKKLAEFISALKAEDGEKTAVFDIWPDVTRVSTCDAPRNFFISSTSIASTEAIKPVP